MSKASAAEILNAAASVPAEKAFAKEREAWAKREQQLLADLERERSRRVLSFGKAKSGKSRGGVKRITFGDTHGCRVDQTAFAAFVADLKVIRPDEIIGMGDHLDCDGFLSSHKAIAYTSLSEYSFAEDIDACNAQFDAIQKAAPGAFRDYLEGNHEYRIRSWVRDNSQNDADRRYHEARNMPPAVLSLDARGIAFHGRGETHDGLRKRGTIKRGKCLYVHGDSHAKNAAAVHLRGCGTNVVYGHTHRAEALIGGTEASGVVGAWNPGCLCELHPMYAHSKPSDWSHGYGLQFVERGGDFLHINVPIVDGRSLLWPMLKALGVTKG